MRRSYNSDILRLACAPYPDIMPPTFDFEAWVLNPRNVMYEEDGSVGLATFEYPGVYNVHWFFNTGGRYALALAREMLEDLFDNQGAKIVRGLTRVDLRPARIMAKKLGFKSAGILKFANGEECESMFLTREDLEGSK